MKKSLLLASIICSCIFSACEGIGGKPGDGDDEDTGSIVSPSADFRRIATIHQYTDYWSGYEWADDEEGTLKFVYGTDKRLAEWSETSSDYTLTCRLQYFENSLRITSSDQYGEDTVYDIDLGGNGYASRVRMSRAYEDQKEFLLEYNDEDRLSKISWEYSDYRYWYMYAYKDGVFSSITTNVVDYSDSNPVDLEKNFGTIANNVMNFDITPLFMELETGDSYYNDGIVPMLTFLRLAGKGCDRLPSMLDSYDTMEDAMMGGYPEPNVTIHKTDTKYKFDYNGILKYVLNDDGSVKQVSCSEKVTKIQVDYDMVVGNTLLYEDPHEGVKYYDYTITNRTEKTLGTGTNTEIYEFTYVD